MTLTAEQLAFLGKYVSPLVDNLQTASADVAGVEDLSPMAELSDAEKGTGGDSEQDETRTEWEAVRSRVEPKLVDALSAGKGDVSKMRAIWALADERAAAGNFNVALRAAASLIELMAAAEEERKSDVKREAGRVVRDTLDGKALLDELKSKGDAINAALDVMPKRVVEARQLIADVTHGVEENDLDYARVAMTKLDILLRDAEPVQTARSKFQMAEGRIASRARGMGDLPTDDTQLAPLLAAYRQAAEVAMTAASDREWLAAEAALAEWERRLTELEKAWSAQLDVEGRYKLAANELGNRGEAISDLSPDAPGHAEIVRDYQAAMVAALDEAEKSDWAAALALVPAWRLQLEKAEKAHKAFAIRKERFDKLFDPLQGDLTKAMKLGAVTPVIGDLCTQMRAKAAEVRTARENQDYEAGVPAVEDLADLVVRLLEARKTYVAQKADWGSKYGAVAAKFAQVEGCGALDPSLDGFKNAFDTALGAIRTKARANDFSGALADLEDVTNKANAFLRAKATWDEAREQVFAETREAGRGDIRTIPTNGRDDGATLVGIKRAMEGSQTLGSSKGLQRLLEEAQVVDALFATVIQATDPLFVQGALSQFQTAIANCESYQREHKENSRSDSDKKKHAQAQALAMHYRAQVAEILETIPVLTILQGIDVVALVGNEAGALRALGQIEGIKASAVSKPVKDLAENKRRALVCNMLKADGQTADQRREVLKMAGGELAESYDRQIALGPLSKTADESRTARDHDSTRIQPAKDAENVDRTRRLAGRLITEDGRLELSALYACNPEDLAGDSPSSRQIARALTRLREDPEAIALLEGIEAPKKGSPAARMVCATLGLEADTEVSAAQARQAALSSLMSELRQKDVGSCFATQVAINVHDTDPKRYLKDVSDMLSKGVVTRTVNGETVTIPIETKMSDAALETNTVTLKRGDDPILLGSSTGGALDPTEKKRLEEAPAFQAAFATMGIDPDDREAAMKTALERMQGSDEFMRNQNVKALRAAVATIADDDQREAVFKAAMAQLDANGGTVKVALEQAMADEAVPDGDPVNQANAANDARNAFDTVGNSDEFDVEPGLVVRQMVMDKVGLTEAEIAKQKEYELAAAALAKDTRPETDPARRADVLEVERLQQECATIRPKILQMEEMKTACYDAFTGGEDNRLLRSYEYTLTALAEESSANTNMKKLQSVEADVFEEELDDIVVDMMNDPAVTASDVEVENIGNRLFDRYQKVFAEGTTHAYDASIPSKSVSADGNSSRGGFYLYDIRGIPSPDNWIKVDDQKKYAALVHGSVMLAWKEEFEGEDEQTRETARFLAEKMADHVGSEAFATKTQTRSTNWGGETDKPWAIQDGGNSQDVLEVLEERTPTVTSLGTPADSEDLVKKVGSQLKALWNGNPDLRQAATDDAETATVNAGNKGVHAFSLLPAADPRMLTIIQSPDVDTAIATFQNHEKNRWDNAMDDTGVSTKEDAAFHIKAVFGSGAAQDLIDVIWQDSVDDAGSANDVTVRQVTDNIKWQLENNYGWSADEADEFCAEGLVSALIPPVAPGDLQDKLETVAKSLDVPSDLVAAVTGRAKGALDTKDATKATMGDIKDEIIQAMAAEGLDPSGVDQGKVNAALREPPGLIFADSNWGDAEHRVKYAMVVNPMTGDFEMWQMNEDGSGASKMEEGDWVTKEWSTVT